MMKKILFFILLLVGCALPIHAAVGDTFTALTEENAVLTFRTTNEYPKECGVFSLDKNYAGAVTIPSTANGYKVTYILYEAFEDCSSLSSVTIPNSVTNIGDLAFSGCSSLNSITIPNSVTNIGEYAFQRCSSLITVSILNSVTYIGWGCFSWCTSLTSITIPMVNVATFLGCTSLTSVTILKGYIIEAAFSDCLSLTSVTISDGVQAIGQNAFDDCPSLTSITIPNSVTEIEEMAFMDCPSLANIIVESGNAVYDSRDNCNAIIKTSTNTLITGCKNTIIPNSVTAIGDYAFFSCDSLASIIIPKSVTSIGYQAFCGCSLTSITIPNSETVIGSEAFSWCPLESVRSHIRQPKVANDIFGHWEPTLYVPIGTVDVYKRTEGWPHKHVEEMTALEPKIEFQKDKVLIISEDASATYYYTLDGSTPSRSTQRYNGPFDVNPNAFIIKAIAVGDDMYDSEVVELIKGAYCSVPMAQLSTEGIHLSSTEGATIYYTTDGSEPTTESMVYDGTIEIDGLCTIKAIAVKEDYNNSEVMTYTIPYYYKGPELQVAEKGLLKQGLDFYELSHAENLTVTGPMNEADFSALREMKELEYLDLKHVALENQTLPEGALKDMNLKEVQLPLQVLSSGKEVLAGCEQLTAIFWNSSTIPAGTLAGIRNPNVLLYVVLETMAANAKADGITNVVANGFAKQITLSDAETGNNFHCPQAFKAEVINYTHDFQQQTGLHECRGWETIALPYDVETVTHETWGELTPAMVNDPTKPLFWLYEYTENGFVPTEHIQANTPYLISMPNNPTYSNEYNLKGHVTFTARNVTVPVTELHPATRGEVTLTPNYERQPAAPDLYVLNVGEPYDSHPEGSVFLPNFRDVRPFEAYATSTQAVKSISLFDDATTSIIEVNNELLEQRAPTSLLDWSSRDKSQQSKRTNIEKWGSTVYDLSGRKVRSDRLKSEKRTKGIYLMNGRKMLIEQ